ncbi:MAG TPA: phosphatidylserine decarboxylase [Candidatus Dormibacteraeota bacterium]|jgi:phosphatidylserine decarboxylase|nr:phosphatidylserine decarboxylase [Candidatus Dormibacteraeota bacterium]
MLAVVAALPLSIVISLFLGLPLAWKWQLGVARAAIALVAIAVIVSAALTLAIRPGPAGGVLIGLVGAAVSLAACALFVVYRFYRDPRRTAPEGPGLIVSPADGLVIYVQRSEGGELPVAAKHGKRYTLQELTRTPLHEQEATVVGIAMSFLDVHINRFPIAGKVAVQKHFAGAFGSLRHKDMVYLNERATTLIEDGGLQIAVVQIASRLVRQIVSFVREGEVGGRGQRLGVIRLGSQVDLVLPAREDLSVCVRVGERVRAGESIVARVGAAIEAPQADRAEPAPAARP